MSGRLVTKRYAQALYEVAEEKGVMADVEADIAFIDTLMSNREIRNFCLKSSSSDNARREFAKIALYPHLTSELTKSFVRTVIENGREALFPFLNEAFQEISDAKEGIVTVIAEFAEKADKKLTDEIKTKMEKRLGCGIKIKEEINTDIIKGFRLMWNGRLIDDSVAGKVRKLRTALLNS